MRRFAKVLGTVAVVGSLLAGVESLAASPAEAQERSCEWVWSWQQQQWVCAGGPP